MRYTLIMLAILTSCSAFMPVADDIEKIADDTAIKIEVSREALQRDTDMTVTIDVKNKEEPIQK